MSFDWMNPTVSPTRDPAKSIAMYRREVAERAALFYRLGYTAEQATARLRANADWDFEVGAGPRPEALGKDAIAAIVAQTFARRPAH